MMDARICFFDLETSNLAADFGLLLSACWKFLDSDEVYTLRLDQFPGRFGMAQERHLVKSLSKGLSDADILVAHYGERFDQPYLNTKLLMHGMKPMPPIKMVDTWRIARSRFKLSSNRLAALIEALDIPYKKTPIERNMWVDAMCGSKKAMDYVVEHNVADVLALEQVYLKLRPWAGKHPNVRLFTVDKTGKPHCPVCGSENVQRRGYNIAQALTTPRFQCRSCGAWGHGKAESHGKIIMRKAA